MSRNVPNKSTGHAWQLEREREVRARRNIFSDSAAHPTLIANGKIVCNRYESGAFIKSGTNTGCPSYP